MTCVNRNARWRARTPAITQEIDAAVLVELHALALQELRLVVWAMLVTADRDLSLAVDHPVPRHIRVLHVEHRIPDGARRPRAAEPSRNLAVGDDAATRHQAYERPGEVVEARRLHARRRLWNGLCRFQR